MRILSRTPLVSADPVTPAALADHLRIELVETLSAMRYADAAAQELEHYADQALLRQTILAEGTADGLVLSLPIGPAAAQTATVEDADGTALAHTFTPGARPVVTLDAAHDGPVTVTYVAGYGDDADAIPSDLSHAILDQALRLYDKRGDMDESPRLAPSAARIAARYRRVRLSA